MENGYNDGKLAEKLSGLTVATPTTTAAAGGSGVSGADDSLFQVMKAVEAAEATIKQQVEENTLLRSELQKRILELERYKGDESMGKRPQSEDSWNDEGVGNQEYRDKSNIGTERRMESPSENRQINGALKIVPGARPPVDNTGFSHFPSPSTTSSFSPHMYPMEGEYDPRLNLSGAHGPMPMTEVNNPNSLWKQDLLVKTQEHEQEITQLRRHLQDYTLKEAHIRNEKYVLEKRIAYMRLAFDQQQQDLVDAASKALSYRQEIIEENIRLTYALQDAQQERTTFVSSLLPLLAEYSLQPPVPDAQSIVSNVKVLFKHLQEKLLLTESKLKESQYQLTPWRLDVSNSNFAPQSPSHPIGAGLTTSNKNGLELVSQPTYSHGKIPISSSDAQTTTDWELHHPSGFGGVPAKTLEHDDLGRYPPLASRNSAAHDIPVQIAVTRGDVHATRYGEETANKQVTFRDPVTNAEMDYQDLEGNQNERESSANWNSGNPQYTTTLDDPGSSYPYLPPVLEEPSSSFSEAADDDPLPAIEGLQISGEAFPGRELQACGYSINGTTSCNFEWVRHNEDGSVNYIDGAKQPNYLVNADDVDTYLAIEVQPLDNRKRKGELVKVFANDHRKITCDSEMLNYIEKTHYSGHASHKVSLSTGYLDIWEPATLAIKKEGYSIKCSGPSGVVVTEKFSTTTSVTIPYGHPTDFLIIGSGGGEHLLRAENNSTDVSCSRDTIVLTLRFFILKAGERRKGKKRGLFFTK